MLENKQNIYRIIACITLISLAITSYLSIYYYNIIINSKITKITVMYDKGLAKNISFSGPGMYLRSYEAYGDSHYFSSSDENNMFMNIEYISTKETAIAILFNKDIAHIINVNPGDDIHYHYKHE